MKQIKNFPENQSPSFDDLILMQSSDGITQKVQIGNLPINGSSGAGDSLNTIIHRDNSWRLDYAGNQFTSTFPCWTSMGVGFSESSTGILRLGFITLKSKLHFLCAGGGQTNGNLKIFKILNGDNIVVQKTLQELLGNTNRDNPIHITVDTLTVEGSRCSLQFEDLDNGNSWSWWSFVIGSFFCE